MEFISGSQINSWYPGNLQSYRKLRLMSATGNFRQIGVNCVELMCRFHQTAKALYVHEHDHINDHVYVLANVDGTKLFFAQCI